MRSTLASRTSLLLAVLSLSVVACGTSESDLFSGASEGAAGLGGQGGASAGAAGSSSVGGSSSQGGSSSNGGKAGNGAAGSNQAGQGDAGSSGESGSSGEAGQGAGGEAGQGAGGEGGTAEAGQGGVSAGGEAGAAGEPGGEGGAAGDGQGGSGTAGSGAAGAAQAGAGGDGGSGQAGTAGAAQAGAGGTGQAGAGGTGQAGAAGAVELKCGDGKATGDEECDDGNQNDSDGCTNGCKVKCSDVDKDAKLNPANLHCYWEENGWFNDTWAERKKQCSDKGGHLVTISSAAENSFVLSLHDGDVWIGATDNKKADQQGAGTYVWVNGEPFDYKSWAPGEPNAAGGGCGVFNTCYEHCAVQREDGLWNDRQCGDENEALCEWDPPGY